MIYTRRDSLKKRSLGSSTRLKSPPPPASARSVSGSAAPSLPSGEHLSNSGAIPKHSRKSAGVSNNNGKRSRSNDSKGASCKTHLSMPSSSSFSSSSSRPNRPHLTLTMASGDELSLRSPPLVVSVADSNSNNATALVESPPTAFYRGRSSVEEQHRQDVRQKKRV